MNNCIPITECLACGNTNLIPTLDLGEQPLANNFRELESTEGEPRYPLAINRCQICNHLQLTHAVDPKLIYTHYLYVSGISGTYVQYMDWYAKFIQENFNQAQSNILDIGCNDGSQLDAFKKLGYTTYGIDPAENLYPISSANHKVICGFWNKESVEQLNIKFDIINIQNAFAHNPNPLSYLILAKQYLTNDGKIFISTSQADMVLNSEFDTIYHEHISYFNTNSMKILAERAGLFLVDIIKTPIHGTSYIFVLSKHSINKYRTENLLNVESSAGLMDGNTYYTWAKGVYTLLDVLKTRIAEYQNNGYKVIGYGAAAKGMTLLNSSRIHLDVVLDDNPLKQGLWCPGTNIPVVNSTYITSLQATDKIVFVPLAWNFYAEIKKKIKALRDNETDIFLRYFPSITTE